MDYQANQLEEKVVRGVLALGKLAKGFLALRVVGIAQAAMGAVSQRLEATLHMNVIESYTQNTI